MHGGHARKSGIEQTARNAADIESFRWVIEDACCGAMPSGVQRSCEALHFAGDAIMTEPKILRRHLRQGERRGLGQTKDKRRV